MEREIWPILVRMASEAQEQLRTRGRLFLECELVLPYLWSALHDRPLSWAFSNPPELANRSIRRPSFSAVARRSHTDPFTHFLSCMPSMIRLPGPPCFVVDSKGFPLPHHTRDRFAVYGPCRGRMVRGYKLHVVIDLLGQPWAWMVMPMNVAEQPIAASLIRSFAAGIPRALLLADAGYDSKKLFELVHEFGWQLVAPRRVRGIEDPTLRDCSPRFKSFVVTEMWPQFTQRRLSSLRNIVERFFAHLTTMPCGVYALPPWVRTTRRVRAWLGAKVVIAATRRRIILSSGDG